MTERVAVHTEDSGKRLDVFLAERVDGLTRSQAKKQIEANEILVGGKAASVHRFLKEGDVVEIGAPSTRDGALDKTRRAQDAGRSALSKKSSALRTLKIVAETPEWIVAFKPAGILMHPTSKDETDTFIDAIIAHAPTVARVGEDPGEPGIVSRLDRDVSGLVIIAKTQDAYDDLKRQFKMRSVEKTYLALAYGDVPQDAGDLKFRIARSASKARMAALPKESTKGRAAWTHYEVIKRLNGAALLRLTILSGRSHQIRAHLFAFNHPIIGDPLYAPRFTKRRVTAPRLLLESIALAFTDPASGERKRFEIDPDPAFEEIMKALT
jgi:23S rRNA pseudouridine1911/1915/1917 synthase